MHRFMLILCVILLALGSLGILSAQASPQFQDTGTPADTAAPPSTSPAPPTAAPPEDTATVEPPTAYPPPDTNTPRPTTPVSPSFAVTGVEPRKVYSPSGATISIYGSGFGAGTAVRLVGYGLLDVVVSNSTAIRAIVPPGVPKGLYSLEIILASGQSLRLNEVVRVLPERQPTPTPTLKAGRATVYGQPQLVIQSASTRPGTVQPGSPFSLTLELVNRGDYTATNVRVSLASTDLAIPLESSNLLVVDLIANEQTADVSLSLALNKDAAAGLHNLEFQVDYSDYLGRNYTSKQSVGINVGDEYSSQPMVLLATYHTNPASLSPGDHFTLELELANVGESQARSVLVTLGGENGAGLKPFAILGAGNVQFVTTLAAGASYPIEQSLIVDGSAASGVYNLPVSLSYTGPDGDRLTETQVLNLLVSRRPQFKVNFYQELQPAKVGETLLLPIELVNIGRSLVNVSTVEVTGEDLEIQVGEAFIGALDGGTTGSLDAQVIPQKSGSLPVVVQINFLDDFNQPQVITQTLSIDVEAPPQPTPGEPAGQAPAEAGGGSLILRILRGLIGLGS